MERKLLISFFILSSLFMSAGALLAYYFTIPLANNYLWLFNAEIGTNLWSLSNYISYTFFLMLANAAAFELGLVLLILVHLGLIGVESMRSKRKHAILMAFILGAFLTPPDVLTQIMIALPLIGLYEIAILYAWFVQQRKVKKAELGYANMN